VEANDLIFVGSDARADEQAFEKLFVDWYGPLHAYACSVLRDKALATEAVQAVFCRLWERRDKWRVEVSLKAYLYGCVYHECVSWKRREKSRRNYQSAMLQRLGSEGEKSAEQAFHKAETGELDRRFREALDALPEKCSAIFQLSRFSELTYREIAEQLGISVKTVEAQMGKALKWMRRRLADFL
jgi:RNA polymerase sigma-70 factor (ECF subfamily)